MAKKQMKFARTDLGNAEMLAWASKDDLRYDHKRNRWLVWREHWWSEDRDQYVMRQAKSVPRLRAQAAHLMSDDEKGKELAWAHQSESRVHLNAMIDLAKSEFQVSDTGDNWDSDPWLIGVANGVIDLRTGVLRPGEQSDRITLHTEVAFDPISRCIRWLQFLQQLFPGDQEMVDFVQRALGYCLTGDTSEQCMLSCWGAGANGKSTFLEVVGHVLGQYSYALPFSTFELKARASIPNDVAALVGKRFVTSIETNESAELNEARIKTLTGSDQVTARFLHKEFFSFRPAAKFWLAFNHKPIVADDSHGFWRRIRMISFGQQFSEGAADKNLVNTLKAESSGILAWAVRGCLEWERVGLGMPSSMKRDTEEYRQENDPLADFLAERCFTNLKFSLSAANLWAGYQSWAEENSEHLTLSRKQFTSRLKAKGFEKVRSGHDRTWIWNGLNLRDDYTGIYTAPGQLPRTYADVNSLIVRI